MMQWRFEWKTISETNLYNYNLYNYHVVYLPYCMMFKANLDTFHIKAAKIIVSEFRVTPLHE